LAVLDVGLISMFVINMEVEIVKRLVSFCLALSLLSVADAGAQSIVQGGPSGTLVSAVTTSTSLVAVYTTPAKGHFVLTQAGGPGCAFSVQDFGVLGDISAAPLTFVPGLLLPPNTAISAVSPGPSGCYIIGVLER
jgi:hypothetical protein